MRRRVGWLQKSEIEIHNIRLVSCSRLKHTHAHAHELDKVCLVPMKQLRPSSQPDLGCEFKSDAAEAALKRFRFGPADITGPDMGGLRKSKCVHLGLGF